MIRYIYIVLCIALPLQGADSTGYDLCKSQLQGVDVSHHQKEIQWDTIAVQKSLDFAFVKATEGADFNDSLFCHNWEALRRLGIRRGAYHFFRSYGCGDEQARHFLSSVEMHPGDLAPVLDIETTDGMPPEIMIQEARIWLSMVEQALRVKPIIYTNQHFYEKYLTGLFDQYPLWIARYSDDRPELPKGRMWDFWQYSNEGCVDGISKQVDLNVFAGTPEMLDCLRWFPAETYEATGP